MPEVDPGWRGVRLEGDGFALRPWRDDDLVPLLRHADDAEVERGLSHRFPHPYTRADGEAFLRGDVVPLAHALAIEIDGEAVGGIGIGRRGEGDRQHGAELGYWLGRRLWGQGRMTRVVGVFAPWAMQALELHRLQATVLAFNHASAQVLLHNGFAEEGTLRDAVMKRGALHDLRVFAKLAPPLHAALW